MSKLEELLQTFCPDGLLSCTFGQVVNYEQPSKYIVKNTDYNDDYETPVLTAGQTFVLGYTNETKGIYNASKESPVIIFDDFTGAFKWVDFPFKVKSSAMKILTADETKVTLRYIYHMMGKIAFTSDEHKRLWIGTYSTFKLPLPSLPVQSEIVRILDNFTELTAELTARKKQYEYYRNELLMFGVHEGTDRAVSRNLGEIAKFVYGYTDKAQENGTARFIRITDISEDGTLNPQSAKYVELTEESEKYLLKKGDLLLARTGATYGKTLYFDSDEPSVYASFLIKIILDNSVIRNRYYWHFSKSSLYWIQAEKLVSKGGQQQFNANAVSRISVPVPSLEIQDKIVDLLDNFEAICSDLTSGLPAEIKARQKQYEYYRDKLLTFQPLEKGGKD